MGYEALYTRIGLEGPMYTKEDGSYYWGLLVIPNPEGGAHLIASKPIKSADKNYQLVDSCLFDKFTVWTADLKAEELREYFFGEKGGIAAYCDKVLLPTDNIDWRQQDEVMEWLEANLPNRPRVTKDKSRLDTSKVYEVPRSFFPDLPAKEPEPTAEESLPNDIILKPGANAWFFVFRVRGPISFDNGEVLTWSVLVVPVGNEYVQMTLAGPIRRGIGNQEISACILSEFNDYDPTEMRFDELKKWKFGQGEPVARWGSQVKLATTDPELIFKRRKFIHYWLRKNISGYDDDDVVYELPPETFAEAEPVVPAKMRINV